MDKNQQIEDIKAIREMMEKSSKFVSFSGISGIVAGLAAIGGATFAYFYLFQNSRTDYYHTVKGLIYDPERLKDILILLADAVIVLMVAIGFGIYFSWKKAKKNNQQLYSSLTRRIVYNAAIPLVTGGIFALIFLFRGNLSIVACSTLIFYGLALVSASRYTLDEIHYLGITEIILGLLAAVFMYNGLLFWTLGFGVCHILYGTIMYVKYDLRKK